MVKRELPTKTPEDHSKTTAQLLSYLEMPEEERKEVGDNASVLENVIHTLSMSALDMLETSALDDQQAFEFRSKSLLLLILAEKLESEPEGTLSQAFYPQTYIDMAQVMLADLARTMLSNYEAQLADTPGRKQLSQFFLERHIQFRTTGDALQHDPYGRFGDVVAEIRARQIPPWFVPKGSGAGNSDA